VGKYDVIDKTENITYYSTKEDGATGIVMAHRKFGEVHTCGL